MRKSSYSFFKIYKLQNTHKSTYNQIVTLNKCFIVLEPKLQSTNSLSS